MTHLVQKYRPDSLDKVIGQPVAVKRARALVGRGAGIGSVPGEHIAAAGARERSA